MEISHSPLPTTLCARLISMHPDQPDIRFPHELHEGQSNSEWRIFQTPNGEIFIKNLSVSYLQIDDTLLEINQEKKLFGGERILFEKHQELHTNPKSDYLFFVMNLQSDLKRERETTSSESENLQKLVKIENDLQKELTCSICTNFLHKCLVLTSCLHPFCSFCLFDLLKSSSECPLCRVEAVSVTKSSVLSNLVDLTMENFPISPKSQERKELEQIDFAGEIVRHEGGIYIGSCLNNKKDGHGKYIFKNGAIYEGDWKNDKKSGKGIVSYANGDSYDGHWVNDWRTGTGKYIWGNGQEYEGNYNKSLRNGNGTMKFADGRIYEGNWIDGKREGKGVLMYPNGDKYDGYWRDDCQNGIGKYTWKNGEEFEGNFVENSFIGYGKMGYEDGRIYEGGWKDDEEDGHGILTLPSGEKYEGEWFHGILQSLVEIEYSNGEKYEGEIEIEEFKKKGKGVLTLKSGEKYKGTWIDDVIQPEVIIEFTNGDRYIGGINVENLQRQGKGVFISSFGDEYDGDWVNDKQHGNGREILKSGKRVYEGVWEEGKMAGDVIITYEDGTKFKAKWEKLEEREIHIDHNFNRSWYELLIVFSI